MIYENICKMAKKRGISINKLEEKAGLSTGSICKWGKSVSPTVIKENDHAMDDTRYYVYTFLRRRLRWKY